MWNKIVNLNYAIKNWKVEYRERKRKGREKERKREKATKKKEMYVRNISKTNKYNYIDLISIKFKLYIRMNFIFICNERINYL